jgi:hypothetical protein
MSHLTTIKTEIRDQEVLIETLEELKIPISWVNPNKKMGSSPKPIDLTIITGKKGFKMGFGRTSPDEPYEIIGRWENLEGKGSKILIDKIYQEYARRKIIKESQKKGFSLILQQRTETGDVRLILKKMAVGGL